MPTTPKAPTASDWISAWTTMAEIAVTAPWVVGYRTAMMLSGGWPPSARDRREYGRMVTEKADAFTKAALVAATSAPGPATVARALAPMRTRVRGNARRLATRR